MPHESYNHKEIEKRAQEKWGELKLNETDLSDTEKEPYYLLNEFPYPSGDLHIGHWFAFAVTDIYARYMRAQGKNVLFPIGFDAFGLPAENAAIKHGLDPKEWTYQNMDRMRTQLRTMGASFDWSKEVVTCEPEYYKWTQWLFLKLYEQNLAERKEASVKWCPFDQTVLANEQVHDGKCERCGHEVEERVLTQWFLKITKYADRLLRDLEPLPWREEIKDAQRAWIGKSEGARITFTLGCITNEDAGILDVFTTRPDTLFGATYVVLAPEHPLVDTLMPLSTNASAIDEYRLVTSRKTERERSENKEKTGVKMEGIWAVNPVTEQQIPVYLADYVLASYGTGAVMAVPAHDERDYEFAKKFDLPNVQVVMPQVTDFHNPPQEGKKNTERNIIIGIVHNPKTDKYLCLKWNEQPWTTFITGGIEPDESAVEAAQREVLEETGYHNLKFTRLVGGISEGRFFAAHKDVNRLVRSQAVLFELLDEDRAEVAEEEKDRYELLWLTKEEVLAAKLQHGEFDLIWQRLMTGVDVYDGPGMLINSGEFTGRDNEEARWDIVTYAEGEHTTNYRMRDWLVSRQRYWGCPIPIVYDPEGTPHAIPSEHLPWLLPTDVDFKPHGKAPLSTSKELHERVEGIFGKGWTPEYDTLDVFVDSSWYFTRYLAAHDANDFSDAKLMKKWLPINRYSGGSEHTTMHLLYSRFFYKALHDLALVPTAEPFEERFNRGIILGPDGLKMSKSKGNVINPDEFVEKYGADAVRIYLAFIGPYNEPGNYPWNLDGVEAMRRFLERGTRLSARVSDAKMSPELMRLISKTAQKVGTDCDRFKFNTAISALMIALKEMEKLSEVPRDAYLQFVRMLAPFAPHLAEHLYEATGGCVDGVVSVHSAPWPDMSVEADELAKVVVQVRGKRRGEVQIAPDASEEDAITAARAIPAIDEVFINAEIRVIYVPGRILNLVPEQDI